MKYIVFLLFACVFIKTNETKFCERNINQICYEDSTFPAEEMAEDWMNLNKDTQYRFGSLMNDKIQNEEIKEPCIFCKTKYSIRIQPVSIITPNEKLYIASTRKYPRPQIDIKVCKERKCTIDSLQDNYQTVCRQKYSQISVLAYNATSREFDGIPMRYPSACECVIEPN